MDRCSCSNTNRQEPEEIALVRTPRELIERAEREQPEKRLNLKVQNGDKIQNSEINQQQIEVETKQQASAESQGIPKQKETTIPKEAEKEKITILYLTETNLAKKKEKILEYNLNIQYKSYWTSASEDKKKGSSIRILIDKSWKKHVGAVKRISEYMIEVCIYFKQLELVLVGVYILLNNKEITKKIQQKVVETVARKKGKMQIIILEDFNHIL
ncbi:16172_t:CDS:2 [Gigaspora margarita]|uniref:16172_t:CDS:1 n=1 Tax=Gigaspora margarita TaxID=4874 RepID=A0ABM8VVQ5_GIGMA|nr:16172_t:CDS:2 [Gigaspora margarita]